MQNEISTLLSDLKEQILYLQELGVENFDADLPETKVQSPKSKVQSPDSEILRERLEKFAAAPETLKKGVEVAPPKIESEEVKMARRSLLDQTRLSRLPSLPKRNSFTAKNQNQEQGEKEVMPRKKTEEIPQETLFGDITQTLPETDETLEDIHQDCGNCTRCPLWEGRTKIVHSTGNRQADLLFIGEAPGANEDAEGEPFVGRAGQLLNKIIGAIGLERKDVFIGNVNRCRPPGNRQPTQAEADVCKQFLIREIAVVRPKIIVVLGNTATQNLLNTKTGITKLRGEFQDYYGVKVMPTFHPAYLLRDPSKKRETWEDMKKVRDELNKLK